MPQYISNFSELNSDSRNILQSFSEPKKEINILWNSNIIYSKGFFHLTESLKNIYERGFTLFKFTILGRIINDKDYPDINLESYIKKIRNYKFVEYIGPVDHNESKNFILKSDFVALPSFYKTECQPLSLLMQ